MINSPAGIEQTAAATIVTTIEKQGNTNLVSPLEFIVFDPLDLSIPRDELLHAVLPASVRHKTHDHIHNVEKKKKIKIPLKGKTDFDC